MDRLVTVAVLLLVLSVSSHSSCLAGSKHAVVAKHLASTHSAGTGKHKVAAIHSAAGKHSIATAKHSTSEHLASGKKHSRNHNVIASSCTSSCTGRRHHRRHHRVIAERHAYPANLFMLQPPEFTSIALPNQLARKLKKDFENGTAGMYPASALVQSGLVSFAPLHGGIFWRRQPVKYLIMHSTESVVPQDAPHIINSWNSLGRRHAGAQYVVDRDGRIYETVDPDLATVHINIFKTLPGINNDNSIGIEMVHAGKQQYTREQLKSVVRLVAYLLQRYQIDTANLITHRYAQRGDHTDPVAFDWDSFVAQVNKLRKHAVAQEMIAITQAGKNIPVTAEETATVTAPKPAAHNGGAADAAVILPAAAIPAAPGTLRGVIPVDPPAAKTLLQAK